MLFKMIAQLEKMMKKALKNVLKKGFEEGEIDDSKVGKSVTLYLEKTMDPTG